MKNFLTLLACISLLAISSTVRSEGIVAIGDSITAGPTSWPRQMITMHPDMGMRIIAQGGRKLSEFSLPRDIQASDTFSTAVYFLGTGDGLKGENLKKTEFLFRIHMAQLQQAGFRVLVILPPHPLAKIRPVRRILKRVCKAQGFECYRPPWSQEQTVDGIHPNPELSTEIANFIHYKLNY